MHAHQQAMITEMLKKCIRDKFQSYNPETNNMPFHYRLLGRDRMALFSFIQSLNTTFGTSIYEPVAIALARGKFKAAKTQVQTFDRISSEAHRQIQTIMNNLTIADGDPNKSVEIEKIRKVCRVGSLNEVKLTKVDIWLENYDGELFLIDMKTAKPNIGSFKEYKRTLLEWVAAELARNPDAKINTMIGIPYNPYEPEPYNRWTIRGMLDLQDEILIAEELWDFIGGEGSYDALLDAFEVAGIELRSEMDHYFEQFI